MILLDQVTYRTKVGRKNADVLSCASLTIPSNRRVALLGSSGEHRVALVNLLGGVILPTAGRIIRKARVSFPVGYLGGFSSELSVRLNVAHVARLYGADVKSVVDFVRSVASLGRLFEAPFSELPKPMRKRLGRILAYSIPFDVYLLYSDPLRGEKELREIFPLFEARARTSGMIIATRDFSFAEKNCDLAIVQHSGELTIFEDVRCAISKVERLKAKGEKSTGVQMA